MPALSSKGQAAAIVGRRSNQDLEFRQAVARYMVAFRGDIGMVAEHIVSQEVERGIGQWSEERVEGLIRRVRRLCRESDVQGHMQRLQSFSDLLDMDRELAMERLFDEGLGRMGEILGDPEARAGDKIQVMKLVSGFLGQMREYRQKSQELGKAGEVMLDEDTLKVLRRAEVLDVEPGAAEPELAPCQESGGADAESGVPAIEDILF